MVVQGIVDNFSDEIGEWIEGKVQEFITDKLGERLFSHGSEVEKNIFILINENDTKRKKISIAKNRLLLTRIDDSIEEMTNQNVVKKQVNKQKHEERIILENQANIFHMFKYMKDATVEFLVMFSQK